MSLPAGATMPSINVEELVVAIVRALDAVGVKIDGGLFFSYSNDEYRFYIFKFAENAGVLLEEVLREHLCAKLAETKDEGE
jgi:hypothetical protein